MKRTYDLQLKTRLTETSLKSGSPELVRGFIVDSFRCWAIPIPDLVLDAEQFVAKLDEDGVYTYDDEDHSAYVRVRRVQAPGEERSYLQFAPKSTPPAGRATAP